MSQALYESLREKWTDFLDEHLWILDDSMHEDDVDDQYDDLVATFCKQYGYSDRTKNLAFYHWWWDTFADEYYQRLEREGVKIIHNNPIEGDWDFAVSVNGS